MKNEVQRANSVANVELTHNEIGVNEDAEVALWGHPRSSLQTRGCGLGLPHTAGQTVKSRRQFAQMWRSGLLDSELVLLEIHPKKMIRSHVPRCVQNNVPCAETETEKERGRRKRRGKESCQKLQLQGSSWPNYVPFISWIIKQSLNSIITMTVD